jgi:hypothetical protein
MNDPKQLQPGQIICYRLPSYRLPTNPAQEWTGEILAVCNDCSPTFLRVRLLDGTIPGEEYIPIDCVTEILSSPTQ